MQRPKITDWKNPNYGTIYRWRNWNLERFRESGRWDVAWSYYSRHPVEAIEDWITTYDPRLASKGRAAYVPLILFPKQREYVTWLWDLYRNSEEGIAEKSRDCGASWVCLAFAWWLWTFHSGVKIGFGSRVERLVDKIGDPDSLLQKFRILMDHLPVELRPIGWKVKDHAPFMRIKNPENGNTIIGEGGRNIGRGGRSSMYFIDEAAFLEYPDDAERALSANTDSKVWVSTPNGTGNPFYRKRFSGNFPVFTFHWRDDPRKDENWYAEKKRTLEPETLAQEVDLDYEASTGNVVLPAQWVRASRELLTLLAEDNLLPAAPAEGGIAGLDVAAGGANYSVLCPRYGPVVRFTVKWSDDDTIDVAAKANEESFVLSCKLIKFDSIGVGRGVAAGLRRMSPTKALGVNVGERPTRDRWPDGKRSKDKFVNLKAELWWIARDRLRRTYEHYLHYIGEGGVRHELDDLLLLPNDSALCAQLSLPLYFHTESGKIQIESKKQMRTRGISSPDHADALILTFAPVRSLRGSRRARSRW